MTDTYSRKDLGGDLTGLLTGGRSAAAIARWAHERYLDERHAAPDVREVLYDLMFMDQGPEFELPLAVLDDLAHALLVGDDASVKDILDGHS